GHKLVAAFGELTIERGIGRGRGGRRSVGGGAADALLDFAASVSRSRRCKSCQVAARSSTEPKLKSVLMMSRFTPWHLLNGPIGAGPAPAARPRSIRPTKWSPTGKRFGRQGTKFRPRVGWRLSFYRPAMVLSLPSHPSNRSRSEELPERNVKPVTSYIVDMQRHIVGSGACTKALKRGDCHSFDGSHSGLKFADDAVPIRETSDHRLNAALVHQCSPADAAGRRGPLACSRADAVIEQD